MDGVASWQASQRLGSEMTFLDAPPLLVPTKHCYRSARAHKLLGFVYVAFYDNLQETSMITQKRLLLMQRRCWWLHQPTKHQCWECYGSVKAHKLLWFVYVAFYDNISSTTRDFYDNFLRYFYTDYCWCHPQNASAESTTNLPRPINYDFV